VRRLSLAFVLSATLSVCWAQTASLGPVLVGAGFSNPFPITVAPGQLLTLFVQPPVGYNSSVPPPTVSAVFDVNASTNEPMPVLQVNQTSGPCIVPANATTCPNPLAVTVQIPLDAPIGPVAGSNILVAPSFIGVTMNGVATPFVAVQGSQNHIHILNSCDIIAGASQPFPTSGGFPCPSVIVHADGKQVSAISPAQAGEELIAYATGLGQTNPALVTGQPAAQSSPAVAQFSLDFNYRLNALATKPGAVGAPVTQPLFSGATQGFVGLYQINFIVPPPPAELQPCVNFVVAPDAITGGNIVQSNLTVSIGTDASFDGAGICVTPVS
jgi:uncharacterized protein (TIGR03437 family)